MSAMSRLVWRNKVSHRRLFPPLFRSSSQAHLINVHPTLSQVMPTARRNYLSRQPKQYGTACEAMRRARLAAFVKAHAMPLRTAYKNVLLPASGNNAKAHARVVAKSWESSSRQQGTCFASLLLQLPDRTMIRMEGEYQRKIRLVIFDEHASKAVDLQ